MIVHIPKAAVLPELASEYEACAAGVEQRSQNMWSVDDQTRRYARLVAKLKENRRAEFFARMTSPAVTALQSRSVPIDAEARAAARLAICQACPHLAGVGVRRLSVLCALQRRRCSCPNGEVSLISGRCCDDSVLWQ